MTVEHDKEFLEEIEVEVELVSDKPLLFYKTHFPNDPNPEQTVRAIELATLYSMQTTSTSLADMDKETALKVSGVGSHELAIVVMMTLEALYDRVLEREMAY